MTAAQTAAREAHAKAHEAHRIAEKGFRDSTARALREAANAILIADIAARNGIGGTDLVRA